MIGTWDMPFAPMPEFYRNAVIAMTVMFHGDGVLMDGEPAGMNASRSWPVWCCAGGCASARRILSSLHACLRSLSEPSDVIMIFTSVIIWLLETVKYWFVMRLRLFGRLHRADAENGLVNLATTLPAAPATSALRYARIKTLEDLRCRPVDCGEHTPLRCMPRYGCR